MGLKKLHVLIYCGQTIACESRSGIQRVVIETIKSFSTTAHQVDLVKWDPIEGQLRYLSSLDIQETFQDHIPSGLAVNKFCSRVNYRFGDTIDLGSSTWLLYPEISYHGENTSGALNKILSQCSTYDVKTACIFYDLIPVRDSDYKEYAALHTEYLLDILRFDKIFPISKFSGDDLINYYREHIDGDVADYVSSLVHPVLLGEGDEQHTNPAAPNAGDKKNILLLGTVEPRKQQTRFLRIFNDLCDQIPSLNQYIIHVVGSLHPLSSNDFSIELQRNSNIKYHRYVSDEKVKEILDSCQFTAFVSRSEGYGLPIVESLQRNVPCLTANFGSMAELAAGGGCYQVNVLDDKSIAEGIKLLTDSDVLIQLRQEAVNRKKRSWYDYVLDLTNHMQIGQKSTFTRLKKSHFDRLLTESFEEKLELYGVTWTLVAASNIKYSTIPMSLNVNERSICYVDFEPDELDLLTKKIITNICKHDLLVFRTKSLYKRFSSALSKQVVEVMPPLNSIALQHNIQKINDIVLKLSMLTSRLVSNSKKERVYSESSNALSRYLTKDGRLLTIIISTFNRANFSYLNVKWLLSFTKKYKDVVKIIVVDNSSTDNTVALLNEFKSNSQFELVVNANNTGMLGNLRVCSNIVNSGHVWLIGDDDFISPTVLDSVIEVISENNHVPIVNVNFSVYHRQTVSSDDSVKAIVSEGLGLSKNPAESGVMRTIDVVKNHDNVFTAVYPIIWRADLLSACFNYPFDGVPFSSLVESIPTTKYILENHALTNGYWLKESGITANAHNSWTKYRPRWHSVLMPVALDLARSSGLSLDISWDWLKVHLPLYNESLEHCAESDRLNISDIESDRAKWIFRTL